MLCTANEGRLLATTQRQYTPKVPGDSIVVEGKIFRTRQGFSQPWAEWMRMCVGRIKCYLCYFLNCHIFACQDWVRMYSLICQSSKYYRLTCGDATSSKKCWFEHVVSSLCIVGGDVCERTGMIEWLNCHTFACQDVFFDLSILRRLLHDLWRCNIL